MRGTSWIDRLSEISFRSLLLNPAALMVVLMAGIAFVAIGLWNQFHDDINVHSDRMLSDAVIELTPTPEWIRTDVKSTAIRESSLETLNLQQSDVVERVADAFAVQAWIESVKKVSKTPRGIDVTVAYRRPVALVEVESDLLLPVDGHSVVLDWQALDREEARRYWRISVPNPLTHALSTGRAWNDLRIADAARIAAAWGDQKELADLFRIVNFAQPTQDPERISDFELWTKLRPPTKVIWGRAPGKEIDGEASATEKIAALLAYTEENGALSASHEKMFDVRSGKVVPLPNSVARQNDDFIRYE